MTQKLYDCSLNDRITGEKVVKLWKSLSKFEVNEVKLRSVIMSIAQKEFEEREEIRREDPKRFLNSIALLGGIFHYLTLPTGDPYTVLIIPLIEYYQFLLQECSKEISCREDELELLAWEINDDKDDEESIGNMNVGSGISGSKGNGGGRANTRGLGEGSKKASDSVLNKSGGVNAYGGSSSSCTNGDKSSHEENSSISQHSTSAHPLNLNGNLLKKYGEDSLSNLMLLVRTTLVASHPSEKCHYWILLILDLSLHDWNHQSFPPALKKFYSEKIGKSFNRLTYHPLPSIQEEPKKSIKKSVIVDEPVDRKHVGMASHEGNYHSKDDNYDRSRRNWQQDRSMDQRERRKPEYWGHDDRFDQQDNSSGGYGQQNSFGGRRGGGGGGRGGGNWRGRGDGRPRRDFKDGGRWNDQSTRENPSVQDFPTSEESWD
ncbi:hypothetical protein J437_LFUL008334 [Ladona fulva]|uniref:Uncharacterized protein n=1 Tax=Ladona fulva TaxID=123851 RepID=A0A8K0KAE9_LADFU|nr:hypothetical protein J437_LFUL008334 [Ladona fulva]